MLYLHPPFYNFEGVSIIPDYHDKRQFYYFPNRPKLAVDENGRPAIRFILFRENLDELPDDSDTSDHATGFLVFDTTLAWPEDTLERVRQAIQEDLDLDELPRLAPLPYRAGSVRLLFLDRKTPEPTDEEDDPGTSEPVEEQESPWVPILETSGIPSLYGENRAIFQAMLTKKAAAMMLGAFEGFIPAGVVYDLTYIGLQRAFNVHVEADWEQVYHYIEEKWSVDLVFVNIHTADILSELEERQIVKITASLEGVDEEGMEDEFNDVRKELQEFILEKFFEPVVNPNAQEMDAGHGGALGTVRTIQNMFHQWPSVGYSRVEMTASEVREAEVDYTVLRAVERRIAPQAHISLFFEDHNITRDQVVTVVNGKDALWEELEFDVSCNAAFEQDGIHSVTVDVYYGLPLEGDPEELPSVWSFSFNKGMSHQQRRAWYNPEVGHDIRYRYTVHFKPDALPGSENALASGWRNHEGSLLVVSPNELYKTRELEVQLKRGFPFDRYPQVHVHLRYQDPDTNWSFEDSELLDANQTRMSSSFRITRDAQADLDYKITYLRDEGEPIETNWKRLTGEYLIVEDPLPEVLNVRIVVAGDKSKISNILIDLRYEDTDNRVVETGSIIIDQNNINHIHQWAVPLQEPTKRRYWYNQTLIDIDGNLEQTGWQEEEKTTLPVGFVYARLMEIRPAVFGPPFAVNQIERLLLTLRYDSGNGEVIEKQMEFSDVGEGEVWKVPLHDASARDYTYTVTYLLSTGFEQHIGPIGSRDTFLHISSRLPGS